MTNEIDKSTEQRAELGDLLKLPEKFNGQKVIVTGYLDNFRTYLSGCRVTYVAEGYLRSENNRLYFELSVSEKRMPSKSLEILNDNYENGNPVALEGIFHHSRYYDRYQLGVRSVKVVGN